jgi:hypothetical protein
MVDGFFGVWYTYGVFFVINGQLVFFDYDSYGSGWWNWVLQKAKK